MCIEYIRIEKLLIAVVFIRALQCVKRFYERWHCSPSCGGYHYGRSCSEISITLLFVNIKAINISN